MRSRRRRAEGFVLVATLWVLAGLAALAAYVDGVASANVEQARLARQAVVRELDRRSTEATLIYLLATNRTNHRGFILDRQQRFADRFPEELATIGDGELWVTDVPYRGLGETAFAVQDENGLVSVNVPAAPGFTALVRAVGVSADDATRLAARVVDYVDRDGRLTLDGAEYYEYLRSGAVEPANSIMLTPVQIRHVLGFAELVEPAQWQRMRTLLTVRAQSGYNFNTMKPEVIGAILDVDAKVAEAVVLERAQRSIRDFDQIRRLTGTIPPFEPEEVVFMPSSSFRITMWHPGSPSRIRLGVRLMPFGEWAPWRKDYQYSEQVRANEGSDTLRGVETSLL